VITRRKLLLALGSSALAAPLSPLAQQKGKVWRVGFLGTVSASSFGFPDRIEALRAGLRELGYVEGRNLVIEFRWADGKYERLPELASELVRLKVDVMVTHGQGTAAAKSITTSVPIVMALSGDPVATGVVASLARPGGNVTGMSGINPQIAVKRLELLRDAFPHARRIAVLFNPDASASGTGVGTADMEAPAKSLKLELHRFGVKSSGDIASAFAAMAKSRVDAVLAVDDGVITANSKLIAGLAAKTRLPAISLTEFAEAGGLMAYGPDRREMFRRSAYFVDRIFKGAKPGDLPVEQATRFETVLNLKTAKALGLQFPQAVLARADRVIE
jgi:putative ABC transport system substrate-binding protein